MRQARFICVIGRLEAGRWAPARFAGVGKSSYHYGPSAALLSQSLRASHGGLGRRRRVPGHGNEEVPEYPPTTDFSRMDVLGATPVPSTSIDGCMPDGFQLNNGIKILDGSGALLVGGEAFAWRPWGAAKKLVNGKGQWEVHDGAFELLGLVWPRPDLLILGLGPEMRPLSPETKRRISALGMRVDVLDTRNAASQFNLLATERGVSDVAAALIPMGWREGIGA